MVVAELQQSMTDVSSLLGSPSSVLDLETEVHGRRSHWARHAVVVQLVLVDAKGTDIVDALAVVALGEANSPTHRVLQKPLERLPSVLPEL